MKSFLFDEKYFVPKPQFLKKIKFPEKYERLKVSINFYTTPARKYSHFFSEVEEYFYKGKTLFVFNKIKDSYLDEEFFKNYFYKEFSKTTLLISYVDFSEIFVLKNLLEINENNFEIMITENIQKFFILVNKNQI